MRTTFLSMILAAGSAWPCAPVTAQDGNPPPGVFMEVMRSDLRNLLTAQESYRAEAYRYGSTLARINFVASQGVFVRLVRVKDYAWSAIARHEAAPGTWCGIFVGNRTDRPGYDSVGPPFPEVRNMGEPACADVPADARSQDPREFVYMEAMEGDLRRLVEAQESYFADNISYGRTLDAIGFVPSAGVTVRFVIAEAGGFSAIATHEGAPGVQCGIYSSAPAPRPFPEVRHEGEPACAEVSSDSRTPEPSTSVYRASMQHDLARLLAAQERYWADSLRYSRTLGTIRFVPSAGVTVRLVRVGLNAWSAIATHASTPNTRCGIFVGNTAPPFHEVRDEGVAACTGP